MARDIGGMKSREGAAGALPDTSFRDALAAALDVTAISREELARRIGRSGAAVSQWINKGDVPDLMIVFKIEDALDLRFGTLVRHHSPDAWSIIEAKTGRAGREARSWRQLIQEGLLKAPLDGEDRKMILDMVGRLTDYNVTQNARGKR